MCHEHVVVIIGCWHMYKWLIDWHWFLFRSCFQMLILSHYILQAVHNAVLRNAFCWCACLNMWVMVWICLNRDWMYIYANGHSSLGHGPSKTSCCKVVCFNKFSDSHRTCYLCHQLAVAMVVLSEPPEMMQWCNSPHNGMMPPSLLPPVNEK